MQNDKKQFITPSGSEGSGERGAGLRDINWVPSIVWWGPSRSLFSRFVFHTPTSVCNYVNLHCTRSWNVSKMALDCNLGSILGFTDFLKLKGKWACQVLMCLSFERSDKTTLVWSVLCISYSCCLLLGVSGRGGLQQYTSHMARTYQEHHFHPLTSPPFKQQI